MINTILFDIGGTLVHKQNHGYRNLSVIAEIARCLNATQTPEELLAMLTAREKEYKVWRARNFIELSIVERWKRFLLPEYPEEFIQANAARLQSLWSESRGERWIPEETARTLRELASRGYKLGSVSHTSPKYLREAGIDDLFVAKIHSAEYGRRKPHPSPFLAAIRACGVLPAECAYIGDRPSRDVVGSREAGISQVILLEHKDSEAEIEPCPMHADQVIHNIEELLQIFPPLKNEAVSHSSEVEPILLYDAAISTMWWDKVADSADDFFKKGRELGFARFELNHQIPPDVLSSIDLNSFHIGTLHDPCPAVISAKQLEREDRVITSLDEERRCFGVDVVKRTIEYAYRLGARSVVIHPGHITGSHKMDDDLRELYRRGLKGTDEYEALRLAAITDRFERGKLHLDQLMKSLQEIVAFAQDTGLSLGFENRFHYYELPIFNEMEVILAEFKQPWVGWQFDVGHLQVHEALGLMSFRLWLDRFSSRIIGTHLHDVQGILDHRAPGVGDVDFRLIAAHLPAHTQRTIEIDKSIKFDEVRTGMKVLESAGCVTRI